MRVHRYVGKKAMIVYLLLAVESGARSLCLISTLYKGGIGQQRQPLKESVAKRKRCAASELEQTPSSAASAVSRKRRGFTLLHSLVPMRRPCGRAAVLSAKAKDFRGGRNGECGEIASSASGGRAYKPHSPKSEATYPHGQVAHSQT